MNGKQRVIIENIKPEIDCGKFPAKRIVRDHVIIEADIFCDSHDVLGAEIIYKTAGAKEWTSVPMKHIINDRWKGSFQALQQGEYLYSIQAWVDRFGTWYRDVRKYIDASTDYSIDLLAGAELIEEILDGDHMMSVVEKDFLEKVRDTFRDDTRQRITYE